MQHDSTPASSPSPEPRGWIQRVNWSAVLVISVGLHLLAWQCALLWMPLQLALDLPAAEEPSLPVRASMAAEYLEEDLEEVEYERREVHEQEIVAEEPVIRDEEVADHVESDNDLPYQESFGQSEGMSDVPFEGPANNGTIGLGGGAGGAFAGRAGGRKGGGGAFFGRGGSRSVGSAGGGSAGASRGERPTTWKRSILSDHQLRLTVGGDRELPLKGVHANVRVDGFRARVILDCYFENDTNRRLEGTFQLRMPDGASPHFLAFGETRIQAALAAARGKGAASVDIDTLMRTREDTWSNPKEARMVPRRQAAEAYKRVVRRRIDPALMEWAGAGVFHTRVFPLAARKVHRIVLGYDIDLVEAGEELLFRLGLPDDVPELLVDIEAKHPDARITPQARGFEGRYRWWNPPQRTFEVRVPRQLASMLRGRDETGSYFALRVEPDVPAEQDEAARRAVFLLDTSLSSGPDAYPVWLDLLEGILERNRGTLAEFALVAFDVQQQAFRETFVPNEPTHVQAALAWARDRLLEGATDLAGGLRAATRFEGEYDVFLLSDGAATWGEDDGARIAAAFEGRHALFAYRTGVGRSDHRMLQRLAAQSGGGIFAVTSPDELAAASVAHARRPWQLEAVAVKDGSDVLVAGMPSWIYPGQVLRIVGRGTPKADGHVRIALRRGDTQRVLRFLPQEITDTELAARAYGEIAVGSLEDTAEVATDVRAAFASHFRVVGSSCSLLMLESEADYKAAGFTGADHAGRVRAELASDVLARARDAATAAADARTTFLGWLESLSTRNRGAVRLPAGLETAMASLPAAAFAVEPEPLACRMLQTADADAAWRHAVAKRQLDRTAVLVETARRRAAGGPADALRLLSTRVEHDPGNLDVVRAVAAEAAALGYGGHAWHLWRRVIDRRPDEPQGLAAMARALNATGHTAAAVVCYEAALAQPGTIQRGAFRRATVFEYLHMLEHALAADGGADDGVDGAVGPRPFQAWTRRRAGQLGHELGIHEADLVVVLTWNTDRTDVDLHLRDPNDEHCYFSERTTSMGGRLSPDVTQGYGPELFVLPRAKAGTYRIGVKYFRRDRNRHAEPVAAELTVYRGWGRADGTLERRIQVLDQVDREIRVFDVEIAAPEPKETTER